MPSVSFSRFALLQAETEKESALIFFNKKWTMEVFPAPDGADITINLPTTRYLKVVP